MAFATSRVDALHPISYVRTLPSAMTRAMAVSRRVAISVSLSQSSISLAVRSIAMGLTLYWPAYLGEIHASVRIHRRSRPCSDPQRAFYFCGRITLSIRRFYTRFDHSETIQHICEVLLQTRHFAALAGDLDGELLK